MFSSQLPDDLEYRVYYSKYATSHFIKRFAKDYKGKRWLVTYDSIFQDLKRVHSMQSSQQVDELKSGDGCKLFKYDFAVAQTNISAKASGNRCIGFLDSKNHRIDVLMVYGKTDLPKNTPETQYIFKTVAEQFSELWARVGQ